MAHVSKRGHLASGKSSDSVRTWFRVHADRSMLEIYVAGYYVGLYR